ncbi:MAG TPA: hypothetical protein VGC09_15050 [Rhodopila sp.]
MARLNAFKVNASAIESGEWIKPGEEYDDLEIKTRGYTDSYFDAQAQRMRRAALPFNGDINKVPVAVARDIRIECLIKHMLLDVRGLVDDAGAPVTFDAFCGLLRDPNYGQLAVACMTAAALVGRLSAQDRADASGNFAAPSA